MVTCQGTEVLLGLERRAEMSSFTLLDHIHGHNICQKIQKIYNLFLFLHNSMDKLFLYVYIYFILIFYKIFLPLHHHRKIGELTKPL